jgi:hypothetical protein
MVPHYARPARLGPATLAMLARAGLPPPRTATEAATEWWDAAQYAPATDLDTWWAVSWGKGYAAEYMRKRAREEEERRQREERERQLQDEERWRAEDEDADYYNLPPCAMPAWMADLCFD